MKGIAMVGCSSGNGFDNITKSQILMDFAMAEGITIVDIPLAEIREDGILMFRGLPYPEKNGN